MIINSYFTTKKMDSLNFQLINNIASFLSFDDKVSFKMSNRYLNRAIDVSKEREEIIISMIIEDLEDLNYTNIKNEKFDFSMNLFFATDFYVISVKNLNTPSELLSCIDELAQAKIPERLNFSDCSVTIKNVCGLRPDKKIEYHDGKLTVEVIKN